MSTGLTFKDEIITNGKPLAVGHKVLVKRKAKAGSWSLVQRGRITRIIPDGPNNAQVSVYLNPEETVKCRV